MKKLRRILALVLASTMLMTGITGCAWGNNSRNNGTVAVIEGEKIPESLYRIYLWYTQQYFEQISGPSIWTMKIEGQNTRDLAKQRALESTILSVVATKKAEELDLKLTKEQEKAAKENAEKFVKNNPDIIETYRFGEKDIENFLLATDIVKLVETKLGENYMPQEAEISKYIEENRESYEQVTATHVLLKTTDENSNELPETEKAKKLATAKEVLQKALNGEDVSKLATEYSDDAGSLNQADGTPDGQYTFRRGKMVKEFEDAAFSGKDGVVWPELVKTAHGYHIIRTDTHIPADEALMREDFITQSKREFTNNEFNTLIANAKVEKTALYDEIQIITTEGATGEEATQEAVQEETPTKNE
nr:peptidylprolyl isomerase [uncultured Niameybacter sp.]